MTADAGTVDVRGAGGLLVPCDVRRSSVDDPGVASVLTLRDLSAQRAVERQKAEFVATVSHELRTPLTSIRGAMGLVESGALGDVPEDVREVVRIARVSCDRLVRMVNDLLDTEKIRSGKLELHLAPVQASELVRTAIDSVDGASALVTVDDEGAGEVLGDADRLVQVLVNLIANALKFSDGKPVTVRVAKRGSEARFEVVDRGPGIAPGDVETLFQRFHQLDGSDTRRHGGTGLGLAISKSLVEQHGGVMGVESKVGAGSSFWFRLPRHTRSSQSSTLDLGLGRRPVLFLVVADTERRGALGVALVKAGFNVFTPADGEAARSQAEKRRPSVLVVEGFDAAWQWAREASVPRVLLEASAAGAELEADVIARLPRDAAPADVVAAACRSPSPTMPTVLVLHEDPDSRTVLAATLRASGIGVVEVSEPEAALEAARTNPPRVALVHVGAAGSARELAVLASSLGPNVVLYSTGDPGPGSAGGATQVRFVTESLATWSHVERLTRELLREPAAKPAL